MNIDLALSALLTLLTRSQEISNVIANARAQDRDVSDAELDGLLDKDTVARAALVAEIAKARAGG